MGYTHGTSKGFVELRFAHCPSCAVFFAYLVKSQPRAVASFVVEGGQVSGSGVRLGSVEELALAERGVQMIAHVFAQHPEAGEAAQVASAKRGQRKRKHAVTR